MKRTFGHIIIVSLVIMVISMAIFMVTVYPKIKRNGDRHVLLHFWAAPLGRVVNSYAVKRADFALKSPVYGTFATTTSKALLKAIENALLKGLQE